MNTVKIFKISVRENVLRQVIFTDRNIFLGVCIAMFVLVFQLGAGLSGEIKVLLAISLTGALLLAATTKVDRQSFFLLIPRMVRFLITKKKVRY